VIHPVAQHPLTFIMDCRVRAFHARPGMTNPSSFETRSLALALLRMRFQTGKFVFPPRAFPFRGNTFRESAKKLFPAPPGQT
jgi:hypothetical protein